MFRVHKLIRFATEPTADHRITFKNFVDYLVVAVENKEYINRHFQPQHGMCDPCVSNFNHILKVTFEVFKFDFLREEVYS